MSGCKHTACRHCGQDIEGFWPYRRGEWRDRGNNATCPDNSGRIHAPVIEARAAAEGYDAKLRRAADKGNWP